MGTGWGRLQAVAVSGSTGEGLLLTALPLLAITITTDPRQVALVNVVGQLPWLLFSLAAGVLIDRFRRTVVLASAFAVQAAAAAVLAVATSTGVLTLPLLLVVSFVVVSSQVLGDGASGALVPDVVGPDRLAAANARMIVIDRGVVQFVVPPVTGFLLAFAVGLPAWLACAAALVALLLTRGLAVPHVPSPPGHPLRDIRTGLAFLVGSPLLRTITVTVALGSFAASASMPMFVLYATQILHVGSVGYGVLMACLAVGWIGASFVVHRLVTRLGYAWSMRLSTLSASVLILLIAVEPPVFALVAGTLVVLSSTTLVWNVCSQSSRQRFTPTPLLGRVLTSHRALAWGLTPLGALAGGFVAATWGLRWVWVMASAVHLLSAVLMWKTVSPKGFAAEEARFAARAS
ncbi:MFS transporter [Umezawaea endophytica]|uniref:MFS transporter n=1 Tax=Umezawaea endophytica TaxID=1654476 RepID=A0A9X2VRY7_9PSEU|nr:MFS transporter [Umezawaea endophytica]MCS7481795.1 MFS transporter [Umezawaea endophytica]